MNPGICRSKGIWSHVNIRRFAIYYPSTRETPVRVPVSPMGTQAFAYAARGYKTLSLRTARLRRDVYLADFIMRTAGSIPRFMALARTASCSATLLVSND